MTFKIFPTVARESRRFYLSTVLMMACSIVALQFQSNKTIGQAINKQIFHPLVFHIRSYLRPAKLDPRIKIFAFDDSTVAYLKATDIPLPEWGSVLVALTKQPNTHLLIDKLFDNHPKESDIKEFVASMKEIKTARTSLITFAHPSRIKFRDEVPSTAISSLQKSIFKQAQDMKSRSEQPNTMTLYGASARIIESFTVFGTANYRGDNYITPYVQVNTGDIVPNAALSLLGELGLSDGGVTLGKSQIPLNHEGKILVNFKDPATYRSVSQSLLPIITRVRSGMDLPILNAGDYVLLLPAMYTGNTDFVDSPFGPIPGGFHFAALLHSALNNDWLREIDDPGFFVLLPALVAFLIGFRIRPAFALGLILLIGTVSTMKSILIFVFLNLALSFVLPAVGLLIGGLTGVILNSHSSALEAARKTRELEVGALVQKSFFPTTALEPINASPCKTIGMFESASECGGDWWGTFHKNGQTYTLIGDAVGHGVPAALVTSVAFAVSRAIEIEIERSLEKIAPSDILMVLNRVLKSMGSSLTQMTFFVTRIDDVTGECVFANAGNQPPFWIQSSLSQQNEKTLPRPALLSATGNVLGEFIDAIFQDHSVMLGEGDKIILFTDGIYENRNASERSQLGKAWLRSTIQTHGQKPLTQFADDFWKAYKKAIGSTPPDDDATVVVVEYRKNEREKHLSS